MTLLAILGIIDKLLAFALLAVQNLPDNERKELVANIHEDIQFFRGLAEKFKGEPQL